MAATIKLGSVGADVETWQGLLTSAGYAVAASGVFDEATKQQTIAWQKAKFTNPADWDGVVGPMSWGAMTGVAAAGKTDKRAKEGRDVMLSVWPQIQSEAAQSQYPEVRELGASEPTLGELQIFGAQAQLESDYGHSTYKNLKIPEGQPGHSSGTIWNWAAEQAGKPPCDPSKSFEASDSGAEGGYTACYRKFMTTEEGALSFLRHVTIKRPTSWAHAKRGDIDAFSVQMHSWTPPLTALGQGHGSSVLNKDPITGTGGYFEQPPLTSKGRAYGLEYRIANIAFTLNEPVAAKRGGPVAPGEVVPLGGIDESGPTTGKKVAGGLLVVGLAAVAWKLFTKGWPWPF